VADKVQVHMLNTGNPTTKLQAPTPNLAIRVASQNTAKAIIRAIQKMQREHLLSSTFLQGVITATPSAGVVTVSIGGSPGTFNLLHLTSYSPAIGDTVWIAVVSVTGDMFVLGALGSFVGGGGSGGETPSFYFPGYAGDQESGPWPIARATTFTKAAIGVQPDDGSGPYTATADSTVSIHVNNVEVDTAVFPAATLGAAIAISVPVSEGDVVTVIQAYDDTVKNMTVVLS
jgi:hypothetical protein